LQIYLAYISLTAQADECSVLRYKALMACFMALADNSLGETEWNHDKHQFSG